MDFIKSDLRDYSILVFNNACCMTRTIESVELFTKTVKTDKEDPRTETINAIENTLRILKVQAVAWTDHGRQLTQFIPAETIQTDASEGIRWDYIEATVDNRIVFVLNELEQISDLCERAGSLRNEMICYLNRNIQIEGTADGKRQRLLEELLEPGMEIGYLSELWKQLTIPRILWRMYLQNHVLLEVRKQKEVFLLSSVLRKFIYKTSEEGSNFRDCALTEGENVDNISVGRCAKLADAYVTMGLLKRKNDLRILYKIDPVVQAICARGMKQMWNAASTYFLEELESGYDESNFWVITDDLCKMAYAVIGIEASHRICCELSKVLVEEFGMYEVHGYFRIAAMILNCANKLYKYLCKHDGKQWISAESKAAAPKRQELDRIFTGGKRILEECSSGIDISPIYYGYMSILSSDQKDALADRKNSELHYASHNISAQYNDLVSHLDFLGHNGWQIEVNNGLYRSCIVSEDEPLLYFEPNVGRSWGDLATIHEVLCSICEKLDGRIQQETDLIKRNELKEIHEEMEKTVSELTCLCRKTGNAICAAEEKLTLNSDRGDPINVLRLIHPSYPYSRELLSWRYGTNLEPLAIQDIRILNGLESAAYTVSAGSKYGCTSVYYNRYHKEVGITSVSFAY